MGGWSNLPTEVRLVCPIYEGLDFLGIFLASGRELIELAREG